MKAIFLVFSLAYAALSFAQFGSDLNVRRVDDKPCFQKALDRLDQRYPDWECDMYGTGAVVDCNEALEADPETNAVYTISSGRPFTGDCETCYRNGVREHFAHFENGLIHGTDTTYYQTGCLQVVRSFVKGIENGMWVFYNDTTGLPAWEINYFNGVKHGRSIYYRQTQVGTTTAKYMFRGAEETWEYGTYVNDTLRVENYVDGVLNGVKKEYFWPGSVLKKSVSYTMGVLDGPFFVYNEEGILLQESHYVKGKKNGSWKYFYDNGNLMRTEEWNKDVADGEFKAFYIQGNIQSIEVFKKGKKHGEFVEHFPDNSLQRQAIYKNDKLIEEHVFDKYGNEIHTVGGNTNSKAEDDDMPETGKKKKKKKKGEED